MIALPRIIAAFLMCLMPILPAFGSQPGATEDKATQIWQLLDYMAVDYAGAVAGGKVINTDEYAEMQEFSQTAERLLGELPDRPARAALLKQAGELKASVGNKEAESKVAGLARNLASALLNAYPVPLAPKKVPNLKQGADLYQAQCASCHGVAGRGDGPLAATLDPAPIADVSSLHNAEFCRCAARSLSFSPSFSVPHSWVRMPLRTR